MNVQPAPPCVPPPPTLSDPVVADRALADPFPPDGLPDRLLAGLGRRFGGPALRLDFTLRMAAVRQIFRRDFVYVSRQLHAMEASRRVQGLDRALLAQALDAVERHGEAAQVHLLQAAAEATSLIARHGEADTPVAFAPARPFQATIVSPLARVFLDILRLADDASAQIERAWLLGLIDERGKVAHWVDCRNTAVAFKRLVRQERHVVGQHVREVNVARREERLGGRPSPA